MKRLVILLSICLMQFSAFTQDAQEAFIKAAKLNDLEKLEQFIKDGVEINAQTVYGATALTFAADKGHVEAVNLLLANGADPNIQDKFYQATPFTWVLHGGNNEVIKAMINNGADLSTVYPMLSATRANNAEIVELLLEKGAPGSDQALLASVKNEGVDVLKALLSKNKFEAEVLSMALSAAKASENDAAVKELENAGAKVIEVKISTELKEKLRICKGLYKTNDGSRAEVKGDENSINISFDGSDPYKLKHRDSATFEFVQYPNLYVEFSEQLITENISQMMGLKFINGERVVQYFRAEEPIINLPKTSEYKDVYSKVEKPMHWTAFRGNNSNGIADGQYPPLRWNGENGKGLKWKTYIPGLSHACPVIWGEKVFIATAISEDEESELRVGLFGDVKPSNDTSSHIWKIYCLDKKSGNILWEKKAYEGVPRVKRHTKATQCNSTPATNGEYIVALFGSEGLVCYDMDGNEQWKKDLGVLDAGWFFDEETQWGHSSSPIIYENMVIVQCDRSEDSYMAAYELATGKEVWRANRDEISSWGTPAIYKGKDKEELITNATKFIRANNPKTGEELWRLSPNSEITVATPVFYEDMIYVTAGYPPVRPVYAIKAGGSGDISIPDSLDSGGNIIWSTKRGGTYMPSPIAYKGYLYTLANNGRLTCYDALTGEKKYSERIKDGRAFTSSIVAADGKLYCTSEEKGVFVIKAGSEFEIICQNPIGEICMATPAISDGMIFLRAEHHVFCFGRE